MSEPTRWTRLRIVLPLTVVALFAYAGIPALISLVLNGDLAWWNDQAIVMGVLLGIPFGLCFLRKEILRARQLWRAAGPRGGGDQ
jgi:hypothetical protein